MSEQNLSGGEIADKASEYARNNPDQARSAIDKIEDALESATGGKFNDAIEKGGDMLEEKLGLPNNSEQAPEPTQPAEPSEPAAPSEPTEPAEPAEPSQPTQPTEPTPDDGGFGAPSEGGGDLQQPPLQDPRE